MKRVHTVSFYHAFSGFIYALTTQPNFLVHLGLSFLVILGGIYWQISNLQWTILALMISIGLSIELINTAIESTVDLLTDQYHLLAKIAKDTAAAAMLVYAFGAIVVAALIFTPKIWPSF